MHHADSSRRKRLPSRSRLTAVVTVLALFASAFIGGAVLPIQPTAQAAEVVVDLGEATAIQHDVTTNSYTTPASAYDSACVRYSPRGAGYSTSEVSSSQNIFASFGYSRAQGMVNCPTVYNDEVQSTVGLKPAATDSVTAGSPFLVATMRHSNRPVVQLGQLTPTVVNGTMDLTLGKAISSSFPWTLTETANTCRSTFDAEGHYVSDGSGQYAYDANGNIGLRSTGTWYWNGWQYVGNWNGNYHYAYDRNGRLVSLPNGDVAVAGDQGGAIYDNFGRSCEDDILEVASATESTAWTDTTTGIQYKLKLWGFVNNGTSGTCSADLSDQDNLEDTFITKENAETYGCLYGSLEQVRAVTFAKDVTTDPSLEDSTTIPTFDYENVSAEGSTALADWGSISSLTPTDWGEAGTAHDSRRYELLAPDDEAVVKESNANTATDTTSGWRLTGVTCVTDGNGEELLNRRGEVLTDSAVNLSEGTLDLSSSDLADTAENTAITCTWHNEYVGRSQLTLVKEIDGMTFPAVSEKNWTLTATPTQTSAEGAAFPYRTISGLSGEESVTGQWTRSGTYTLSEATTGNVEGFSQQGDWSCVNQDGDAVAVTDSQVTLGVDEQVTCTVTNTFKTGSIQINKTVSDPDGGLTDQNKTYTGTYDCGSANGRDFAGTWSATTATPAVISGLPVGAECTVTEDAPSGDLKDDSYEWTTPSIDNPTVQVPTAPAAGQVNVTNTIVRNTGTIDVNKVVEPADETAAGGWTGGADRTFEVSYTCDGDGGSGTLDVSTGTPATLTVPAGTTCSFTETAPETADGDFKDSSYEWTGAGSFDKPSVTVGKDTSETITVTNTYKRVLVDLNVAKQVDGEGYNGGDATFAIDYDCGADYAGTVNVANGASTTVQVPRGALCTVSEPASSLNEDLLADAYDWGTPSYEGLDAAEGTMVSAADGGKTVTVVNPTEAAWGKVAVTKNVSPDAGPVTAGTTFPVTVTCDAPAQGETENYTGAFDLAATGSEATATTPYIAAGANCTVSETAPTGSTGLTDASYKWTAGPEDQSVTVQGDHTEQVTVTNTWQRDYGDFTITKQLTDLDGQGADNTYTGTWTCSHPGDDDATGTWSVTGSGAATLSVTSGPATAGGTSAAVLLGSTCTVTEEDPGAPNAADSSYVFSTAGTTSGPVTIDPDTRTGNVDVTNVVARTTGGLTITKSVEGAEAGTGFADTDFTFTYTCTPLSGEAITGTATVRAGQVTEPITGIPEGSSCTVTESTDALPAAIDPYRWDADGTSMTATPSTGASVSADGGSISFTMPGGDEPGVAVAATNTMSERYGSIQVTKTVADNNKANGFTGAGEKLFPITVTCDGAQAYSGTLADGETVTVGDIPLGQTCTVTEGTISGGLADGSYAWGEPTITDPVRITSEDASSGTVTVTNTIERVRADVNLNKVLSGELATQFGADNTYSGAFTCTHDGDADVTGTWSVDGAGNAAITYDDGEAPYVDSTCTPTEDLDASGAPDTDPSFSWGEPSYDAATVTADGTAAMTVTNTVNRDMGSLTAAKTVIGETDGLKDGQTFTLNATCTAPGVDGELTATATVADGESGVAFDREIPAGWTCAISETSPTQDQLKDSSYAWEMATVFPDEVTITKDETVAVSATNTIRRVTSDLSLTKAYGDGLSEGVVVDESFSGDIACHYDDGQGITQDWSLTWTADGAGAATIDGLPTGGLPLGTVCTAAEDAPTQDQLKDISYRWAEPTVSDPVTIGADAAANTLTVTNDAERAAQPLTITKAYTGIDGALNDGATVRGGWSCTQADGSEVGGRWELPASGGSTTVSEGAAGATIYAGADCTLTEDTPIDTSGLTDVSYTWNNPAYDVAADGQTFTDGNTLTGIAQDSDPVLRVTNSTQRIYGALAINKLVNGLDGVTAAESNTYAGTWACTAPDGTGNEGTWRVTGAGAATLTGDYTQILVGSDCTVTETGRPTAPVSGDPSYQWTDPELDGDYGTVTQAQTIARDATSTAEVTNAADERTLATGFTVNKAISGATDGATGESYTVDYTCTAGQDTFTGTLTLPADGTAVAVADVPVGATCTLTEAAPGDDALAAPADGSFTWTDPMTYEVEGADADTSTPGAVTFTLPAQADAAVTATVTNDVAPHAGVNKTFTGTSKHLDADGNWTGETWDVTYEVTVTNPSQVQDLTYDLVDTPTVPEGTTLNSITVTGGALADALTQASGPVTVVDGATLPAGATHTYTVVLNVTAPDTGIPGVGDGECSAQAATDGTAIHNTAAVTSGEVTDTAEDCGDVPTNPKFSVRKDGVDVVRNGDTYTATYTVTVENTSRAASQIIADVTDTPALPETAKITGVAVLENGEAATDAEIPGITDGVLDGPITLARADSGPVLAGGTAGEDGTVTGGGTRVITVQVSFTVDSAADFEDTDYQCGHERADGAPSGLVNTTAMVGDTDGDENNTACLDLTPRLTVSKSVATTGVGTSSSFDVAYTITVTNEGELAQSTGLLRDKPDFAPGLDIDQVTVTAPGGDPVAAAADAEGYYTLTAGDVIAPGQSAQYTITFTVTVDPGNTDYSEELLECSVEADGTRTPGHGLFNEVYPTDGRDASGRSDNTACEPVTPDAGKRIITLRKTGTQVQADGTTNLPGAEFDIYDVDPATDGAAPIENGVSVDPVDGSLFTSAGLPINHDYWVVETKAPAGHSLLPRPIQFHLGVDADGNTTITLAETNLTADTIAVIPAVTDADGNVVTAIGINIHDVETGTLPLSGGRGIGVYVAWAGLLLTAALVLTITQTSRRRGRRA
ncbi:Conserved repeat domain protein [Actinomyces succiniciruminis]|uniref:Conserved repeat domain protein n=1 Tax=Actinomyces succiniciruminis TaxID=1522002 RepID=A0A1L7RNX7_9ACTO|nr:Conserved repeat domain protein [Actinomyces succiniciruminis]